MPDDNHLLRLLVVDDEPAMADLVVDVATSAGFTATALNDATRFEAVYADGHFDVVVLDLIMPGRDGVEILRFLGERRATAALVLMSGYDDSVLNTTFKLAAAHGLRVLGALSKPFRPDHLATLLAQADGARAAARGGERGVEIGPAEIAEGLDREEFLSHYQPQIGLRSGAVIGFEALARWQRPATGLVPPDRFIAAAERHGLIDRLTWELLAKGVAEYPALFASLPAATLSINVSHHSLYDLAFPDTLIRRILDAGIDPSRLILEITETGVMQNTRLALDIIARFRLKGFRMSIDDFGAGSAMFGQLERLPITELKIDQSFVFSYFSSRKARAIVEKTIELGHDLGLEVVAEGVETADLADALLDAGCDTGQGYYFCRPLPLQGVREWLDRRKSEAH